MGMMFYRFPEEDRRGGMRRRGRDGRFRPSAEYRDRMERMERMEGESYRYDDDEFRSRRGGYRSRGGNDYRGSYRNHYRHGEGDYGYYDDDEDYD